MSKSIIKNIIRLSGYELHKQGFCTDPAILGISQNNKYPYIKTYEFLGVSFKFWIINKEMEELYNLDLIKNYSEFLELNKLIKRGDRILEVGSNQGFFFTFMSKLVGVDGYVVGLEPLPKNAIIACSQIGLNDNSSFTAILNAAASFDSSNVFLTRSSHNASVAERNINNTVETKSITCDSLLETYKSFDLIKIDVEGYEENVLKGCQKILETKPKLAIELHMPFIKKYNSTLSNIFNLININHYDGTMIFRKDKTKSYPFDPKLINNDVINLFLKPKVNI